MDEAKRCSHCGKLKPLEEFNKRSRSKDGLQHYCRECQRAANREWYDANRVHVKHYRREYYLKHPEQEAARSRRYRQTHAAEIKARRDANREERNAGLRAWRHEHRYTLADIRRARKEAQRCANAERAR